MEKKRKRFAYGDVVRYTGLSGAKHAVRIGALAQVVGYTDNPENRREEWLRVLWVRDGNDKGQSDGNYNPRDFDLVLRPRI
jgi:hypothetical protein